MIRARFAPSPTGYLHIGSARTFIFNWLYARRNKGAMILCIDDTDIDRNTEASLNSIYEEMSWLDLEWDEFYRQSERLDLHRKLAYELLEKGLAYRDFRPAAADLEDRAHGESQWLCNPEMRALPKEESQPRAETVAPLVKKVLEDHHLEPYGNPQFFARVVDTIRSRYSTLLDFPSKGRAYFADNFHSEKQALEKLDVPGARALLHELAERIAQNAEFSEASVEADLRKLAEERGVKAGVLINASRGALTGQSVGPSAFVVFVCIGRERAVERLRKA